MGYYVQVDEHVKIYVEDFGEGRPVLFIHGWPLDHRMYEYQVTHLPPYGFRCIRIDLRGFGQSDQPWDGYGYDRLADDLRIVIDTLHLQNLALVGFSMGGAIAIRYMARHAGHGVSQLLLLAAAAPAYTQRTNYPYGTTKEEVNGLIHGNYTDRPAMLNNIGSKFFASSISPSFREWFHSLGLAASSHGTAYGLLSLRDEDLRPDMACIQVPTFIFHGTLDQLCPFVFAKLMHQGIPNSQLIRFERSGHGIFYDELELFNHRFLTVLRQYQ
jgi:non-heme chloroperoxidase